MIQQLRDANKKGMHICVGLDTDLTKIPSHILRADDPLFDFNRIIIDSTRDYAAAYKINLAFYESLGIRGIESMLRTIEYLQNEVFVIGDGKRGDIGNSSDMYAKSMYEVYRFDSCTVAPYMGQDSIEPFLKYEEKLTYVLALTSNPGSKDLQLKKTEQGTTVFEETVELCRNLNVKNNTGLVFGATQKKMLEEKISAFMNFDLLLPGVGAQGARLEDIIPVFAANNSFRYLINFSRSLLYCDTSVRFHEAVRSEIKKTDDLIRQYL
ncbi:MAG: orotidine-5'-phosphate decarboxylase [Ignavibacteriales bacterium]|nr:MAG: orotidine-5'-phosphate decarboxylase [Ignavibacteriales bacterium]